MHGLEFTLRKKWITKSVGQKLIGLNKEPIKETDKQSLSDKP